MLSQLLLPPVPMALCLVGQNLVNKMSKTPTAHDVFCVTTVFGSPSTSKRIPGLRDRGGAAVAFKVYQNTRCIEQYARNYVLIYGITIFTRL